MAFDLLRSSSPAGEPEWDDLYRHHAATSWARRTRGTFTAVGNHERFSAGGSLGLIRMGVRLYDPSLGRSLSVDPVEGGTPNDYVCPTDGSAAPVGDVTGLALNAPIVGAATSS